MVFAEGKKYDGRWKDDLAYGVGVFTGGGITYDGNWMNGKVHLLFSLYYKFILFPPLFSLFILLLM